MNCPFCTSENLEGADQCAGCHADLVGVARRESAFGLEQDLANRPIAALIAQDYLGVSAQDPVGEVVRKLIDGGHHCAVVVDGGSPIGIFTERDVLQKLALVMGDLADAPIADFMTADPVTLDHDVPIVFALNRMMVGGYRHLPILRDGELAGVVSVRDVLGYMVAQLDEVAPAPAGS